MIELLAAKVWESSKLHNGRHRLAQLWLQRELGLDAAVALELDELIRLLQSAAILSASPDEKHRRAAYDIATYAHDLGVGEYEGVSGVLRVILTRLGNFPALSTSALVGVFQALPISIALEEEVRRRDNQVTLGENQFTLTDFQARLWRALIEGRNVTISGPTSAGKSFILQTYLRRRAGDGRLKHACYLVPSRALISQVTDDVVAWRNADGMKNLTVSNVPVSKEAPLPEQAIFVLTQERLQVLLSAHPDFSPELVIIDEAQNVQDGSRGVLLSSVVDMLLANRPDAQVVFAGPNLKNGEAFGEMFALDEVELNKTTSVVVGQNLINVNTRSFEKGLMTFETMNEGSVERRDIGNLNIGRISPSKRDRLAHVATALGRRSASIVYADDPDQAEQIAKRIAEPREAVEDEHLEMLSDFISDAVHPKYMLGDMLRKRVGFHYGRMPSLVRRSIEEAFSNGDIDVLVTTSTLLQGVNFPAKNLLMCKPRKGKAWLDGSDFWNLAGRAGRLGQEFHGNVYLIDYDEWDTKPVESDRELVIIPFLQEALTSRRDELIAAAREPNPPAETNDSGRIEAALLRLHLDSKVGRLGQTLDRCGVGQDSLAGQAVIAAMAQAELLVHLPRSVLLASPTVAAYRQQRLYDHFRDILDKHGEAGLPILIPRHPRDSGAFEPLARLYKVCHEHILGVESEKLHRRFAAISLAWMRGDSMPEMVNANARFNPTKSFPAVIRGTLDDIEQQVRFKYFRLTSCYLTLLEHALKERGWERYATSIPALPLFLEVGASSQTMISLMALGLSRMTASRLANETGNQDLEQGQARNWLGGLDLDKTAISRVLADDVRRTIAQAG